MSHPVRHAAKRLPLKRVDARLSSKESTEQDISAHDQLVAVKASLEAVSASLSTVDPASLADAEHVTWSNQLNQVDLAIARVRNSLLNGIVAAFEKELPQIQQRTARLEADLAQLTRAVDVINAVAAALGVIEQIVMLGL